MEDLKIPKFFHHEEIEIAACFFCRTPLASDNEQLEFCVVEDQYAYVCTKCYQLCLELFKDIINTILDRGIDWTLKL